MIGLGSSMLGSTSNKSVYISKALGVKEYAYCEDMNYPSRRTMEDGYFIVDDFLNDGKSILFGVFDGHGGRDVVEIILANFPKEFKNQYLACKKNVPMAMENTFLQVDEIVKQHDCEEVGSTACVGIIYYEPDTGKRVLCMGNVGDTRAVIGQMANTKMVSYDHKASDKEEADRVKKDGGSIFFNRVEGQLAVTRAFGDFMLKDKGVTARPFLYKEELRIIDKFLIIASDGLWDVCTNEEAVSIIKNLDGALSMSKKLVETALKKFSKDNVSVMILVLN